MRLSIIKNTAPLLEAIRVERDRRLAECDWTQLPDAPVDQEAWAEYRRALRELPDTVNPVNPEWPTPPSN